MNHRFKLALLVLSTFLICGNAYAAGSITTLPASDITDTTAILNGSCSGADINADDFRYQNVDLAVDETVGIEVYVSGCQYDGSGSFYTTISGLVPNTVYEYFVHGDDGDEFLDVYGDTLTFQTDPEPGALCGTVDLPCYTVIDWTVPSFFAAWFVAFSTAWFIVWATRRNK